jgi:hypothetical protein
MRFSRKQLADLVTIEFFIPPAYRSTGITEQDRIDFMAYSDRGEIVRPSEFGTMKTGQLTGYQILLQAKRWRGIHMELWETGIMDGSVPIAVLVEDLPPEVIDFAKRELFKGFIAEMISSFCTRAGEGGSG